MKLTKTASGYKVSLTVADWKAIGVKSGWFRKAQSSPVTPQMEPSMLGMDEGGEQKEQAVAQIKQLMEENGVTVDDLEGPQDMDGLSDGLTGTEGITDQLGDDASPHETASALESSYAQTTQKTQKSAKSR
jgi:hypothetical protein